MLTLLWPWALLILPLPFIFRLAIKPLEVQIPALRTNFYTRLALAQGNFSSKRKPFIRLLILSALWACLVVAATRPQWVGDPIYLPTSGRDLLLAVDISESMKIEDMLVGDEYYPRLAVVKSVVQDFVKRRTGDKLGLILFGSQAYLQVPLTYDKTTLSTLLQEAKIGFAGKATAIGDAIGIAVKRLEERPAENRVLILLSDGADTASELPPNKAAQLAAYHGIRIYTVGIGADEMVRRSFFGSRTIHPSMDLDEASLKEIARLTGGQYFRATDPEQLIAIYQKLDELEPVVQEQELLRPTRALFYWPLAAAFVLFLTVMIIQSRERRYA